MKMEFAKILFGITVLSSTTDPYPVTEHLFPRAVKDYTIDSCRRKNNDLYFISEPKKKR